MEERPVKVGDGLAQQLGKRHEPRPYLESQVALDDPLQPNRRKRPQHRPTAFAH